MDLMKLSMAPVMFFQFFIEFKELSLLNFAVSIAVSSINELLKIVLGDSSTLLLKDIVEEIASFISVERSVMVGIVLLVDLIQTLTEESSLFSWDVTFSFFAIVFACTAAHLVWMKIILKWVYWFILFVFISGMWIILLWVFCRVLRFSPSGFFHLHFYQ